MNKISRRYDIDWLRTIGVYLVIPFHALIVFIADKNSVMFLRDDVNVPFFCVLCGIIDRFHMPLLFLIAGMAAFFSLHCRTNKQYLSERVKKLLVPALFGCVFINPFLTYIYLVNQHREVPFIQHVIEFFTKNPGDFNGTQGGFTPAQLWFIIYLFVFSLLSVHFIRKVVNGGYKSFLDKTADVFSKPMMMSLFIIPITIISAINIWGNQNPLVYFAIFCLGTIIADNNKYREALRRDKWIYLVLSIVLIYIRFTMLGSYEAWTVMWILEGLIDKASRLFPVFAIMGIGDQYLNKNSSVLQYLSQASFPIYVMHMVILCVIGFVVIKLRILPQIEYIIIVSLTFIVCFILYEVFRCFKVTSFLLGIKSNK